MKFEEVADSYGKYFGLRLAIEQLTRMGASFADDKTLCPPAPAGGWFARRDFNKGASTARLAVLANMMNVRNILFQQQLRDFANPTYQELHKAPYDELERRLLSPTTFAQSQALDFANATMAHGFRVTAKALEIWLESLNSLLHDSEWRRLQGVSSGKKATGFDAAINAYALMIQKRQVELTAEDAD